LLTQSCSPPAQTFDNAGLGFPCMHMTRLVSCGIEYKMTQDKGTHAIAPDFVYCYGIGPFFVPSFFLPSSWRYWNKTLRAMLLSYVHYLGSV
jgi:hypothetical protein